MANKIKTVFFDVDDTLYDSTTQTSQARKNAVLAMIEAGLEVDEDEVMEKLQKVIDMFGSNYPHHFNELLRELGCEQSPRLIAAGVVAYHSTKIAYLVPFPDTIPTLLKLRDMGYRLGVITEGVAVKQWEKLIRLGLQHFFHTVVISGEAGMSKPDSELFRAAAKKAGCSPGEAMMVGDRLDRDVRGAREAGMVTVQIMRGKHREKLPKDASEEPDFVASKLSGVVGILLR